MTYTIFTGCSYTEGLGLENTIHNPNLWVNVVHESIPALKSTTLLNLGISGATNDEIFQNTIKAIGEYNCRYLFVAWTSINRYKVNPGVELYSTQMFWAATDNAIDIMLNPNIKYTKEFLNKFKNTFIMLNHSHYQYIKILNYSYIIKTLCDRLDIKVFFVNCLLPHDAGYFLPIRKNQRVPSDTTIFTQTEFCASTRSDEEFFKIYDQVHNNYAETNGLSCQWLNLDRSFRKEFNIDFGSDNLHPGSKSHRLFGEHLVGKLHGLVL